MSTKTYTTWVVAGMAALMGIYAFAPIDGWKEITMKEYDQFIEKSAEFFEGTNISFSVDVTIASYKTHQTPVAYESQQGYFIRSGKNYHHFMMGIHSYQNKNYRFVVDSTEKNILVANPGSVETDKITMATYKHFHSFITKVYKLEQKETDKIRVDFSEKAKASRIEMLFDKKGLMLKTTTYFRMKLREDPTDKSSPSSSPRIEITFKNYKKDIKTDYRKEFDESGFFYVTDGKFVAAKAYADYMIKDTRLKTK
jgi:hypothetical protein